LIAYPLGLGLCVHFRVSSTSTIRPYGLYSHGRDKQMNWQTESL